MLRKTRQFSCGQLAILYDLNGPSRKARQHSKATKNDLARDQLGVGSGGDVTGAEGDFRRLEQSACVLSKSSTDCGVLKEIPVDSERSELKHLLSYSRIQ